MNQRRIIPLVLAAALFLPLVAFAASPNFGEPICFAAHGVVMESVTLDADFLWVEFQGPWTEVPEPLSRLKTYPKNGFGLRARTAAERGKLKEIAASFQARGSRQTSFSLLTGSGFVAYGGIPLFAMENLKFSIGD